MLKVRAGLLSGLLLILSVITGCQIQGHLLPDMAIQKAPHPLKAVRLVIEDGIMNYQASIEFDASGKKIEKPSFAQTVDDHWYYYLKEYGSFASIARTSMDETRRNEEAKTWSGPVMRVKLTRDSNMRVAWFLLTACVAWIIPSASTETYIYVITVEEGDKVLQTFAYKESLETWFWFFAILTPRNDFDGDFAALNSRVATHFTHDLYTNANLMEKLKL